MLQIIKPSSNVFSFCWLFLYGCITIFRCVKYILIQMRSPLHVVDNSLNNKFENFCVKNKSFSFRDDNNICPQTSHETFWQPNSPKKSCFKAGNTNLMYAAWESWEYYVISLFFCQKTLVCSHSHFSQNPSQYAFLDIFHHWSLLKGLKSCTSVLNLLFISNN